MRWLSPLLQAGLLVGEVVPLAARLYSIPEPDADSTADEEPWFLKNDSEAGVKSIRTADTTANPLGSFDGREQ